MAYRYRKLPVKHPKNDTLVSFDGVQIARTYQFGSGPREDQWGWFGKWDGTGNSGRADSLQEALEAVKFMHTKLVEGSGEYRWPDHQVSRLPK